MSHICLIEPYAWSLICTYPTLTGRLSEMQVVGPTAALQNQKPWGFSSVQSLSRVRFSATPWTAARQASCLSPAPRGQPDSRPWSRWRHLWPSLQVTVVMLKVERRGLPLRLQAWAPSLRLPSPRCLRVSTHCPPAPPFITLPAFVNPAVQRIFLKGIESKLCASFLPWTTTVSHYYLIKGMNVLPREMHVCVSVQNLSACWGDWSSAELFQAAAIKYRRGYMKGPECPHKTVIGSSSLSNSIFYFILFIFFLVFFILKKRDLCVL